MGDFKKVVTVAALVAGTVATAGALGVGLGLAGTASAAGTAIAAAPIASAALGVSATAGILQARQQRAQGKAQEAELKRQAETEKLASIDREGQRRRRLNLILGTTIAETGARGIKFEGSPQAVARAEIGQAGLAIEGAKVSDLTRIAQLKRAGRGARIRGSQKAAGTLLTTGAQTLSGIAEL